MKKCLITLIVVILLTALAPLSAEEWVGDTIYPKIVTPHPYPVGDAGELVWSYVIHETGASWLKPRFSQFKITDEDYIELIDMEGNIVETIRSSDLYGKDSRFTIIPDIKGVSFWGPAIDGNQITVNLYRGKRNRKGWGFKIDQVGVGAKPILGEDLSTVESICGSDNKTSIACAGSSYQTLGRSVGRMSYQKGSSWYVCTGFLVSCNSSHFLTNEHCITSQTEVNTLQVRFYYRLSSCGGSNASYSTYYGSSFVTDNTSYDFCLLTLSGSPQNTYGYLTLINGNPVQGEDIYIIQHPAGRRQEIGYGTVNSTSANSGKDFNYYVDTEGGSSGSPVFAEYEDQVLGLHHFGGCPNSAVKMNYIYEYITNYLGCN